METISKADLKAALETLGLDPENETSESGAAAAGESSAAPTEETELQKAEKAVALAQAKLEAVKNPTAINKAEIVQELSKASNEKFKAIATIMRSKDDKIEKLEKSIETLMSFNEILGKRLGIVEKTPMQPKAIRGKVDVVERFAKGGDGENGEQSQGEAPVYSLSNPKQKSKVASLMLGELKKAYAANGALDQEDEKFRKAISQVEISNVSDGARQMIEERLKIRLTR